MKKDFPEGKAPSYYISCPVQQSRNFSFRDDPRSVRHLQRLKRAACEKVLGKSSAIWQGH